MTDSLIRAAYRVLLGREPESEAVVEAKLRGSRTPESVLKGFVASPEFKWRHGRTMEIIKDGLAAPRSRIETDVTPVQREALFRRIHAQWSALGETEPYWSVVTDERFKRANLDQHQREFFEGGKRAAALLDAFAARAGVRIPRGRCLELGCGVGRVTIPLAARFDSITALDVSSGNLEICRNHLAQAGTTNVETRLLSRLEDLERIEPFDVFYSLIVLQHNPPPIIKFILRRILRKARPGGLAFFQVPTNPIGYTFDTDAYLASPVPVMELHALPMHEVFGLLAENGFRPLEVILDGWTAQYGSHTFFAIKES
jgi:2-polyprenyl-3-methyl-5-hydroxy-6-metoxy-1,4-benzoquinol methylase